MRASNCLAKPPCSGGQKIQMKPVISSDFANVSQLVCLSNLENLNALFINEGLEQAERLRRLNQIAIQQMRILVEDRTVRKLEGK